MMTKEEKRKKKSTRKKRGGKIFHIKVCTVGPHWILYIRSQNICKLSHGLKLSEIRWEKRS